MILIGFSKKYHNILQCAGLALQSGNLHKLYINLTSRLISNMKEFKNGMCENQLLGMF